MNRGLIQAAWNGDVQYLIQEIDNNPAVLQAVALECTENLLHVACFAGHVNFAVKVMELRPGFCRELNQEGFSPLHITAAGGNVEIVKKLLEVNQDLCLIEGKDGKIPLHLAVVKGKVEIVNELLLASSESIASKTAHGEISLHLAVNNNQFQALQVLIQHLKQFKKEDLLNSKDNHGNTILHLAVSKKQYQVVKFLLNGPLASTENMELNSLNERGLTPLDMLVMFQSEAGDREIEEILIQAGARKYENLQSPADQGRVNHPDTRPENRHPRSWSQYSHFFRYNQSKDSPGDVRNTLLVIAILTMTATYQIAVSPPGGVWQDDSIASTSNSKLPSTINDTKPHTSGKSIMGTNNPRAYIMLMCANSFGFFMSFHMIYVLTGQFLMRLELLLAMYGLCFCYGICVGALAPYDSMANFLSIIMLPMGLILLGGTDLLRYIWRKIKGPIEGEEPYTYES